MKINLKRKENTKNKTITKRFTLSAVLLCSVFVFTFLSLLLFPAQSQAAVKYWIGAGGGNFTANTNWSTTSGGANDTVAPTASDIATFDSGGNTNCTIDGAISVAGIDIKATYTLGTISPSSAVAITVGSFTQAGGTFTSTEGTMTITGPFTKTGGTFNEGTGTVIFGGSDAGYNVATPETFYNVTLNKGIGYLSITTGQTIIVTGTLTLTSGYVSTGTIDVRGNITQAAAFGGGSATIDFGDNAVAQTYTINGGTAPSLRLDNIADASDSVVFNAVATLTGLNITAGFGANVVPMTYNGFAITVGTYTQAEGTFTAPASLTVSGPFTKTGGTFNEGTGTVIFGGSDAGYNVATPETFYNVTLNKGIGYLSITTGQTIIVTGTLTLTSGYVSTGTIDVRGNIILGSGFGGGARLLLSSLVLLSKPLPLTTALILTPILPLTNLVAK